MNQTIDIIIYSAAMTLLGCLCGFFIVLNYITERIEREERKNNEQAKK